MKLKRLKFRDNHQEGAAAVEFALVLPLLLVFIFGIIEFGLFLFNQQVITNAVREGARTGVVMRAASKRDSAIEILAEDTLIRSVIENFAQNNLITFGGQTFDVANDVTINDGVTRLQDDFDYGNNLKVEASFDYHFLFLSSIGIGPINLKPISIMKME